MDNFCVVKIFIDSENKDVGLNFIKLDDKVLSYDKLMSFVSFNTLDVIVLGNFGGLDVVLWVNDNGHYEEKDGFIIRTNKGNQEVIMGEAIMTLCDNESGDTIAINEKELLEFLDIFIRGKLLNFAIPNELI